MCFYTDNWCFLGEIDEKSFHLAAIDGRDGDAEGSGQRRPRPEHEGESREKENDAGRN